MSYKNVTSDLANDLDQVSESFKDISRLQKGVIKGFTEITQNSTATGQAWISVARFFSGSAFWRIQNKVKAVSNALQFMQKLEERRNKQIDERMVQLAKTEKHQERLLNIQEKIEAVQKNSAEYSDYKALTENKMYQLYKREHGVVKATAMMQEKIAGSLEKVKGFEEDLLKIRAINYGKTLKGSQKKDYDSYTQEAQMLMLQIHDLKKEGNMLNEMMKRMPRGDEFGDDKEKQQFKEYQDAEMKMKNISAKINEANDAWTNMSEDERMQGGYRKSLARGFKQGFDPESFSKLKGVKPFDKIINVFEKLNAVKEGLKTIFNPKFVQKIGSFVGTALRFLVKFLLYGALIVLMLMAFKEAGGFELVKHMYEAAKDMLLVIGSLFISAMTDLFDFFEHGLKFINALFTGTSAEAMEHGTKMLLAGSKFIVKMVGVVMGLLVTIFYAILAGIYAWVNKKFIKGKNFYQQLLSILLGAIGAYAAAIIAANMLSSLNPYVAAMGAAAMSVVGFAIGGWMGKGAASGFSSGDPSRWP